MKTKISKNSIWRNRDHGFHVTINKATSRYVYCKETGDGFIPELTIDRHIFIKDYCFIPLVLAMMAGITEFAREKHEKTLFDYLSELGTEV